MLIHRILAALVLIPCVIFIIFYAPLSIFTHIMIAFCILAAWEWCQFLSLKNKVFKLFFVLVTAALLYLISWFPVSLETRECVFKTILMLSVIWWLAALLLVVSYPSSAQYWRKSVILKLLFAFFTIVPFFIGMVELRKVEYEFNIYTGSVWLLYVFVLVWATDTGAYFAGRVFGKRKLAPNVSPGKTVAGLVGGVSTSVMISLIAYSLHLFSITFSVFFISSLIAIFASVLGDLTESMFKRDVGIKDSGHIIPGHGGILDRIDSLTSAIPLFAALSLHLL